MMETRKRKFLINTKQTKLVTEYVRCVLDVKYETYVAETYFSI